MTDSEGETWKSVIIEHVYRGKSWGEIIQGEMMGNYISKGETAVK